MGLNVVWMRERLGDGPVDARFTPVATSRRAIGEPASAAEAVRCPTTVDTLRTKAYSYLAAT